MADRVLFISWGNAVPGREEHATEVFNDAVGLYGRLQQEGRIESFDACLLEPNGDLGGYFQLHGSADQLSAVREIGEFRDVLTAAGLIVERLRMVSGATGAAVAEEMQRFGAQVARVPQPH
jgi:hypothetical protein